jgi:hypothetical protein
MTIDPKNQNHIIADEGKVFQRKSDNLIYGEEIYLGYTYYINGQKLDEPHLEVPEDFIEIDKPQEPHLEVPEDFEEIEDENKELNEE